MSRSGARLLVTGATGQLGALVVERLLRSEPPETIAVLARKPEAAVRLREHGVDVRVGDYDSPASLTPPSRASSGSSSSRPAPSGPASNSIATSSPPRTARVGLIAYTSVIHADTSPLQIAEEHRLTEQMIIESGSAHVMLRNGWYTENYLGGVAAVLERGVLNGAAGDGRIASATRADYAAAASAVLLADDPAHGAVLELAGDDSFSLPELAAKIARRSGTPVRYENLDPGAYEGLLKKAGLPAPPPRSSPTPAPRAARCSTMGVR